MECQCRTITQIITSSISSIIAAIYTVQAISGENTYILLILSILFPEILTYSAALDYKYSITIQKNLKDNSMQN